jgi:23S rRNA pseudouridine1911/1915/1917 synthase
MNKTHALEILFEDNWLIVIEKPSGMLSVGFPGYRGKTAQDILSDMKKSRGKIQIAVVHRLDRDTSGVMMYAKSAEAKKRIMDDWQEIVTERTYRAVCARTRGAKPLPDSGTIDAPLAYNRQDVAFVPREGDRAALKEAEKAVTHFRVVERGQEYDLVECELETGRKNQIRAHMAHLGHPVVGDEVYGVSVGEKGDSGPIGRLALHARVLAFTHPFTGDTQRFESPEPASFLRLVQKKAKAGPSVAKSSGAATVGSASSAGEHVPRRQRGRRREDDESDFGEARDHGKKKRDEDDVSGLAPIPKRSRTKQPSGKSRFIPGK